MASQHSALVIIGTGMAGLGLARALRRGKDARSLTLISRDGGEEYSKPLLSTGFAKKLSPERLAPKGVDELARELDARLVVHNPVVSLDVDNHCLTLDDGGRLTFDQLVLATGATPRAPFAVPESVAARCFTVNDLDDYRRLHAALADNKARVAVVGAGLVGCEFANDLHAGGHQVTLIAPEGEPLPRLLPAPLGQALASAFTDAGMALALKRTIATFERSIDDGVTLTLDDGSSVEADIVLLATGLAPETSLAEAAGLAVSAEGITVDRYLRTSHRDIFALGDAACVEGISAMYVAPLQAGAKTLAATLSGTPTAVAYGAWPVVVKTPLLPVVAYPPRARFDHWRIEGEGGDLTALAEDAEGRLQGFALTGGCVRRKVELSRAAPTLLG